MQYLAAKEGLQDKLSAVLSDEKAQGEASYWTGMAIKDYQVVKDAGGYDGNFEEFANQYFALNRLRILNYAQMNEKEADEIWRERLAETQQMSDEERYREESGRGILFSKSVEEEQQDEIQQKAFAKDVQTVIKEAEKKTPSRKIKAGFGAAKKWLVTVSKRLGLDIEGYKHIVDANGVRHIKLRHGEGNEIRENQIPVTNQDIENIPNIVNTPDYLVYGTKTDSGRDGVGYLKTMPDGSTYYVEEVRDEEKQLAAKTLYKIEGVSSDSLVNATVEPTSETTPSAVTLVDKLKKSTVIPAFTKNIASGNINVKEDNKLYSIGIDKEIIETKEARKQAVNSATNELIKKLEEAGIKSTDVDHSLNRNLGYSNYFYVNGLEIRVSDHGKNPLFNSADVNVLVGPNEDFTKQVDDTVDRIKKYRDDTIKKEREIKERAKQIINDDFAIDWIKLSYKGKDFKKSKKISTPVYTGIAEKYNIDSDILNTTAFNDVIKEYIDSKGGRKYFYEISKDDNKLYSLENLTTREDGYQIADDNDTVDVVKISENAVLDFKTKRELVAFIKNILGDERNITIKSTGDNVFISNRGIERGASKARTQEYNEAFRAVRQLLENAKYSGFIEADEKHPNVRGQDVYHSGLVIGNKPYSVMFKIDIPQGDKTHNYAGHKISDIQIAPTNDNGGQVTIPAKTDVDAIRNISLAVLRGKVNPARKQNGKLYSDEYNEPGKTFGSYDMSTKVVELMAGHNPSTLTHELSHHFFISHIRLMEEMGLNDRNKPVFDWLSYIRVAKIPNIFYNPNVQT